MSKVSHKKQPPPIPLELRAKTDTHSYSSKKSSEMSSSS